MNIRTELLVLCGGIRKYDRDGGGLPILVDAMSMDGQQRRGDLEDDVNADKDPFGLYLLPGGSDEFVSVLLHRPVAVDCTDWFTNPAWDLTSECTRVRRREKGRTKGPPRIFSSSSASIDDVETPAEGGMVIVTTMTQGLRYLSFH